MQTKNLLRVATTLICFIPTLLLSQISLRTLPYSVQNGLEVANVPLFRYTAPSLDALQAEDAANAVAKGIKRIGTGLDMDIDFFEYAEHLVLPDQKHLYRLAIETKEAEALSFYFDVFKLSSDGVFFIYNDDFSQTVGGFNATNANEQGGLGTQLIGGERIIIEYLTELPQNTYSQIHLQSINYAYRHTGLSQQNTQRDFGDSDFCEVNVNCSEGLAWTDQRDAIVRILIKEGNSFYWCSGTVMNNVRQDCTPYILSAEHCSENPSAADLLQWIFYFNYQGPFCTDPAVEGALANQTMVGATKIAQSNDGGGNSGSDFLLLELNNDIPALYNPFYAGWDANNTAPTSGVGIHHPAGDIKKISTFSSTANSTSFGNSTPNTHWGVQWVATANGHGVTEVGSSGSPLFDANGRVVGTLTGGAAFCNFTSGADEYGKMSYHWQSNGNNAINQLGAWLDPDNTGTKVLNGVPHPCTSNTNTLIDGINIQLTPNPATAQAVLEWNASAINANVVVYDLLGRYIKTIIATRDTPFNVSDLNTGVYLLQIELDDEIFIEKLIKQ